MLEALLGMALIAQEMDDWQEDVDGDETLLLALTAYDMRIGRRTSFRISEVEIRASARRSFSAGSSSDRAAARTR